LVTLGDHLRAKRIDLGLLQRDVAHILKADAASVYNWENNRNEPSFNFIPRIIDFLGYIPTSLIPDGFGKRIAFYRRTMGFTQKELAWKLSIDPSTLAKWEQGKRRLSKETVKKLKGLMDSLAPDAELFELFHVILER